MSSPADLTVPSPDPGIRAIIEQTTDHDTRHRVATDPTVVAIATRATELTADQRRQVSDAHADNFNTYRTTLSRIRHRVRKAGGPTELTVRALNERIADLLSCHGEAACEPYHVCGTSFFPPAVEDTIFAHLAGDYLTADEQHLFNGPFLGIAGDLAAAAPADEEPARRRAAMRRRAEQRRISAYAGKFAAETVSYEPPRYIEPTDTALAEVLAPCGTPPRPAMLPEIRQAFTDEYADKITDAIAYATGTVTPPGPDNTTTWAPSEPDEAAKTDDETALAREYKRVVRHFERYTPEQRANHAASHRVGPRQRTAVGETFYTHPDVPGRAFPTRTAAAKAAVGDDTGDPWGPVLDAIEAAAPAHQQVG